MFYKFKSCSLILCLFFSSFSWASPFMMGKITQASGEIHFFKFASPYKTIPVQTNGKIETKGSYLTQDDSFFTVQLFDGSWIRISPKTKISIDFAPESKTATLHLFSGSVKVLFASSLNGNKIQKLVIKSADAVFETVEGKFSVVRNIINNTSKVLVEKGAVIASHEIIADKKDVILVHAGESTLIKDRDPNIPSPRKLSEKEMKFLQAKNYLKIKKDEF
jgi:ferric-dicitrate binding protein FerR (iron transport regulator)